MINRERAETFKAALSDILETLPSNQSVNTTLHLKDNNPESIYDLVDFWVNKSDCGFRNICSALSLPPKSLPKSGPAKTVSDFLENEKTVVEFVVYTEYSNWSNNRSLPFTAYKD